MKIIAGNWKMNGSIADIQPFADSLLQHKAVAAQKTQIIVCPPFPMIAAFYDAVSASFIAIGGQDCSPHDKGAFTGDVSPSLLKECGATCVIVGHSERRQGHSEGDDVVKGKASAAIAAGLTPILCVGETLEQRESGKAETVIRSQLEQSIPETGEFILAYEPIWAIGTGKTASSDDIRSMHGFIKTISKQPVLYGGSVKPDNAAEILALADVDGVLVGGASLKAEDFLAIITAAG